MRNVKNINKNDEVIYDEEISWCKAKHQYHEHSHQYSETLCLLLIVRSDIHAISSGQRDLISVAIRQKSKRQLKQFARSLSYAFVCVTCVHFIYSVFSSGTRISSSSSISILIPYIYVSRQAVIIWSILSTSWSIIQLYCARDHHALPFPKKSQLFANFFNESRFCRSKFFHPARTLRPVFDISNTTENNKVNVRHL